MKQYRRHTHIDKHHTQCRVPHCGVSCFSSQENCSHCWFLSSFPGGIKASWWNLNKKRKTKPDSVRANPLDKSCVSLLKSTVTDGERWICSLASLCGVGVGAISAITLPAALVKDYYPRCISTLDNPF